MGRILRGVCWARAGGADPYERLGKKGKYFESTASDRPASCFREHDGGPTCLGKEGSDRCEKAWPFRQACGSPKAYMWYLLARYSRKHLVKCENQTAVSTKMWLQLVLRILYFPKPDHPQSKPGVSSAMVGGKCS